jgi:natural product biosynthesis luciferase-like monooxygenase protein
MHMDELNDGERWLERLSATPAEPPMAVSAASGSADVFSFELKLQIQSQVEIVAGFVSWLGRTTGARQFSIGSFAPELQGVACAEGTRLLSGYLPVVCDLDTNKTFNDLVVQIGAELLASSDGAEQARDVLLGLPELREPEYPCQIAFAGREPQSTAALRLVLDPNGDAPRLVLNASGYPETNARKTADRLIAWITATLANRDVPFNDLPILDANERNRLLVDWNATATAYPRNHCVHQLIEEQTDRTPDAIALAYRDRSLSYAELDRRANRLAQILIEKGAGPDALVGLCLPRTEALVIAALAIWKAGAAYVPLDPDYPADRLALMVQDSQARLILCDNSTHRSVPSGTAELINLDVIADAVATRTDARPPNRAKASHLAYAIYTSGSTGKPKGVLLEHRNVTNFFTGMDAHISDRDGNVWLAVTSLSFDISVLELFWTLARGFKIVIASSDRSDLGPGGDAGTHSDKGIEFSLFYFAADSDGTPGREKYRLLIEGAKFADENGFSAVSTPERHFGGFGGLYPNPAVAGAALAMITKRIQIRAGSCVAPLHHPARVAEEWAVVDNLSDGRVGLSFASGWHPRDFLLWPDSFSDKKGVMLRNIEIVRKLWRGESVKFPSPVGEVAIETRPRPVQAELPVWVTAAGHPETFASAGRIGANILTHLLGQSFDEMASKIQVYRKAWRDAGYTGEGKVTLMLHTFVGPDATKVKEIVRQPMKNYLKSSLELIGDYAWSFPAFKKVAKDGDSLQVNFQRMSAEEMDALLEFSFERYYAQSGLFGTPESCTATIDRLKGWGVDDVACLIDFGIDADTVLQHLPHLNELRKQTSTARAIDVQSDDFSLSTQIKRHQITHLQCTPSMMRMLLEHPATRSALSSVRHVMIGGEALPDSLVSDIASVSQTRISNMYGPTETTIWSSVDAVAVGETVTIGRPIANTTMYVLDGQKQPVPVGAPGELYIGGDGVARGYHARPDLTADRFVPDPFDSKPEARLYRTGDLVKFRDDARIEFIGRVDHQVKLRGYRIELGEIETRLSEIPGVKEAVVMVREDRPGDPRLCAYLRSGQTFDTELLRKHLSESLPDYMIPGAFVTLAQFPLTPNKKVDRKALPAPDASGPRAEYAEPEGDLEGDIVRVFQAILGLDQVGRDDNFFQVGGHSLLAVQAHRKLREALARDLSVTDIFRFPTARQLAAHLDNSGGENEALKQVGDRGAARRAAMMRRKRGRESETA